MRARGAAAAAQCPRGAAHLSGQGERQGPAGNPGQHADTTAATAPSPPCLCSLLQGNVARIEVWWQGGAARRQLIEAGQRQQQAVADTSASAGAASPPGKAAAAPQQQQQQPAPQPAPLSVYLPHAQMPSFREPGDTVVTAVRLTFARGLVQVRACVLQPQALRRRRPHQRVRQHAARRAAAAPGRRQGCSL